MSDCPFDTSGGAAGKVTRGDNHSSQGIREIYRGRGAVRIRYAYHVQRLRGEEIHASSRFESLILRAEEALKTMKSMLEIRPVMHRTPERIKAHVFLCVLALLLERVAERSCESTWLRIRHELRTIKVGQLLAPHGTVYQTSVGSIEARNILRKLKIESPPSILGAE